MKNIKKLLKYAIGLLFLVTIIRIMFTDYSGTYIGEKGSIIFKNKNAPILSHTEYEVLVMNGNTGSGRYYSIDFSFVYDEHFSYLGKFDFLNPNKFTNKYGDIFEKVVELKNSEQ